MVNAGAVHLCSETQVSSQNGLGYEETDRFFLEQTKNLI